MNIISDEKLNKYFIVTRKAYELAKSSGNKTQLKEEREDFLDMIRRYIDDAQHFADKGDRVNAFAALNYAHGWLDSGVRLDIFEVKDTLGNTVFLMTNEQMLSQAYHLFLRELEKW